MENVDKLVVVTGGTKGIGKAILEVFGEQGYSLATCSRNENDLDVLKKELESKFGVNVHTNTADLSKKQDTESFIEFIRMIGKSVLVW